MFDVCCCQVVSAEVVDYQLRWAKKCWVTVSTLCCDEEGSISVAVVTDGFGFNFLGGV